LASFRASLRGLLVGLGLLGLAQYARNAYWSLTFIRPNARYRREGAPDGQPIPPFHLRILVAASPDIGWFLESGRRGAESIRDTLQRNGLELADVAPILDFGGGCGRVTRHFAGSGVEVHGSDLNTSLVGWSRDHLRFAAFTANDLAPPLSYADGRFGFVYALSVFTHLPEPLQAKWMQEMRRVLRPGGHLLLTTHGEEYLNELTADEQRQFQAGRLVVHLDNRPGANSCGAYHPEAYVRERLAAGNGFSVIDFVPKGALGNPWQDLWLLRRD
jgi:SAM-dependent methyltransferase